MPLETLVTHRQLRGHVAAYQCCGSSLIGSALVGFDVRQQAHIQHLTDVFHGQPAKEAHLDDLGLSRIDARQVDQRLVERTRSASASSGGATTTASSSDTCWTPRPRLTL